jgi:plastocyanin
MKSREIAAACIAVVVLALIGCGGSSSPVAATPVTGGGGGGGGVTADVTITISGFSFSPNPASVKVGQTVVWHNGDSVTHTATADGGAFDTGAIAPGATSGPITMSAAGSLAYHCAVHPGMVGSLTVTQ